jgi:hypothetical protein
LIPFTGATPLCAGSGSVGVAGRVSHCGSAATAPFALIAIIQQDRRAANRRMDISPLIITRVDDIGLKLSGRLLPVTHADTFVSEHALSQ